MELQNIGLGLLSLSVIGIIFICCMICGCIYSLYYNTEGVKILSYKYDGRCIY